MNPMNQSTRLNAVMLLLLAPLACVASRHTVEPFKSDVTAAAELAARAVQFCSSRESTQSTAPSREFVTDGCSLWPDNQSYVRCCVEHDIRYWCGGSRDARATADAEFGACVADHASKGLGTFMRLGVRMGGHPVFPFPHRWGYGHRYRGSYPPINPDE